MTRQRLFTPTALLLSLAVALSVGATPAQANDAQVVDLVNIIYDGDVSEENDNIVMEDEARKMFWAFHVAKYLDVIELRVYMVPFESANPAEIRAALDAGDDDAAFESILANMNLSRGAMYVADVGLNGILDEDVPIGQGRMRDNFHREQFSTYEEANTAYMQWLERAVTLKQRSS